MVMVKFIKHNDFRLQDWDRNLLSYLPDAGDVADKTVLKNPLKCDCTSNLVFTRK